MIRLDKLISNIREQIDELAQNDTKLDLIGYSSEKGLMYESMKFELANNITNNIVGILNDNTISVTNKLAKIISPIVYTSMCNFVMEYNIQLEKINE